MRFLLLVCLLGLLIQLQAQVPARSWLADGFSVSTLNLGTASSFLHILLGEGYYHPSQRLGVGGMVFLATSDFSGWQVDYGLAPGVRYYFSADRKTVPLVLANAGALALGDQFRFFGRLGAGVDHFVTRDLALEALLGYTLFADGLSTHGLGLEAGIKAWITPDGEERETVFPVPVGKGVWTVGAGFTGLAVDGFALTWEPAADAWGLALAPRFGYFIGRQFLLGADLLVNLTLEDDYRTTLLRLFPHLRYYLPRPRRRWQWFAEAGLQYEHTRSRFEWASGIETRTANGFDLSAGAGANFFLSPHFALEGKLAYRPGAGELSLDGGFRIFLAGATD